MIKLELTPSPAKLTEQLQAELTQKFKETGNSVWDIKWLKEEISAMSFGKCCYSEIRLGEESKYMEVEHFYPKDIYPDEVMAWGNLLPSCKKCNGTKRKHDTKVEPIVNPFVDNPKDYLCLKDSRYKARNEDEIGKRTIKVLALNDWNHFIIPRTRIANEIKQKLADICKDFDAYEDNITEPIGRLERLMKTGVRTEEYAALVATTILENTNYKEIEIIIREKGFWNGTLQGLLDELMFCALLG